MDQQFKYQLGDNVAIGISGEQGKVRGRAQYVNSEDNYFLLYKSADGRAIEAWWPESTLRNVDQG